jgi:hypothetical protein
LKHTKKRKKGRKTERKTKLLSKSHLLYNKKYSEDTRGEEGALPRECHSLS